MKIKEIALYVYLVTSIAALIGVVGNFDLLLLVSKPVIIPAIYFYYLAIVRRPNLIFTFFLIFTFVGDTIVILKFDNPLFTMIPYFISYIVLMKFIIEDSIRQKLNLVNVGYAALLLFLLMIIFTLLIDIPDESAAALKLPMAIWFGFGTNGGALNIQLPDLQNNFFIPFIDSEWLLTNLRCFYVLYNLHFHISMLNYINVTMQFVSYYFFVKYMLCRKPIVSVKL